MLKVGDRVILAKSFKSKYIHFGTVTHIFVDVARVDWDEANYGPGTFYLHDLEKIEESNNIMKDLCSK